MTRTFVHNSTPDAHMYSESHVGKCYRHCKGHRFFHFFKTRKFLSKLKIENERYVHLIFSVKFLLSTRGLGLCKNCFRLCLGGKIKNYIQRLRFRRSCTFSLVCCTSMLLRRILNLNQSSVLSKTSFRAFLVGNIT